MTQPAKSQEPSMEEILASIRRIIADDDASKTPPKPAESPRPAAPSAPLRRWPFRRRRRARAKSVRIQAESAS
jgi:cell pole-organizing protein PopZ